MRKVLRIGEKGKVGSGRAASDQRFGGQSSHNTGFDSVGIRGGSRCFSPRSRGTGRNRYSREMGKPGHCRWGSQKGSVYLADQKLRISRPGVRDRIVKREVHLASYELLQIPRKADEGVLRRVLNGLSCRKYEDCAEAVPEAFG